MFLWVYKTNLEGVPRDPNFRGGIARGSISADLFKNGNEADDSLCIFTRVSSANVTSFFGTSLLLMGRKTNWEGVPPVPIFRGGGMKRNSILGNSFSMEPRLTNNYVPLQASFP